MAQSAFILSSRTITLASEIDFVGWRDAARELFLEGIAPSDIAWVVGAEAGKKTPSLDPFPRGNGEENDRRDEGFGAVPTNNLRVPRAFVEAAETAILHSDPDRFAFLYRLLWRLRSEPHLMHIASDPDIRRLEAMQKAIRRDIHKMRAFVRFREVDDRSVAWFEPYHFIVERNADFFVRRFTGMKWSILTPYRCAHWDGKSVTFGPGASKADAPSNDAAEELWLTYYRNIFNPARLKVKAMQAEMPKKYWRNLPETPLIADMISGADNAAREMIARMPSLPSPHHAGIQMRHWPAPMPADEDHLAASTLGDLAKQAHSCRRCPLWREATQTVFGAGPETARVVFVGEQPGDYEDIKGEPFVGPAGKVFDAALEEAGIDRSQIYITNAVKHFKFEPRGKRRIHSKPNAGEVQSCRWWLDRELGLLQPDLVVALGATAALSLLGKAVAITTMRGEIVTRQDSLRVFLTIHPSFILRIPDADQKSAENARFRKDMHQIKLLIAGCGPPQ